MQVVDCAGRNGAQRGGTPAGALGCEPRHLQDRASQTLQPREATLADMGHHLSGSRRACTACRVISGAAGDPPSPVVRPPEWLNDSFCCCSDAIVL